MKGLYVHIPFCARKCHYCNFIITVDRSSSSRGRFFSAFENEIRHARERYGRLRFDTLYLGGGTPSELSPEEMGRILNGIRRSFDFEAGHELTCEMNPGDGDFEKIKAYKDLGINRVSLGTQAFQDPLLEAMGRLHRVRDIFETVRMIRETGIENVSFDLMMGLPGQTLQDFETSLAEAVLLGASQFSLYDLEIHEKTFWGIQHQRGLLNAANEGLRALMFEWAYEVLIKAGYKAYEISTFARPGFESRHNLIYWHNQEYLGLGPGAFSYLEGVRYQFAGDVNRYLEKCETGQWAADTEDVLSEGKKETETLLTGLRLSIGVDLEDFKVIRKQLEENLQKMRECNLVERRGSRIFLTPRGRSLAESTFTLLV